LSLLLGKISELERELSYYRNKKNSSNSSLPPSQDPFRAKRTESLRQSSGRNPGGQPGHNGNCLKMSLEPTEVIHHQPNYCTVCGKGLSECSTHFIGKRQVIDIPQVKPTVTEHQVYGIRCTCGHLTQGDYPSQAHSAVCYGSNIQGLTAYFHARQYIPFERLREMYSDVFGLPVSSGCLANMIQSFSAKASGIYETIRQRISLSPVVGADETGTCIKGKNGWTWVFQTPDTTYIHSDQSRSKAVIDKLFPQGFAQTVLVHDCWKPYFKVTSKGHQICTAHLLRELKFLDKLYPQQQWSGDFTSLLHRALELKKTLSAEDYLQPVQQRTEMEKQLDILLNQTINIEQKKLIKYKLKISLY
jgi:transposase